MNFVKPSVRAVSFFHSSLPQIFCKFSYVGLSIRSDIPDKKESDGVSGLAESPERSASYGDRRRFRGGAADRR